MKKPKILTRILRSSLVFALAYNWLEYKSGGDNLLLSIYIVFAIILLIVIYRALQINKWIKGKEKKDE